MKKGLRRQMAQQPFLFRSTPYLEEQFGGDLQLARTVKGIVAAADGAELAQAGPAVGRDATLHR